MSQRDTTMVKGRGGPGRSFGNGQAAASPGEGLRVHGPRYVFTWATSWLEGVSGQRSEAGT